MIPQSWLTFIIVFTNRVLHVRYIRVQAEGANSLLFYAREVSNNYQHDRYREIDNLLPIIIDSTPIRKELPRLLSDRPTRRSMKFRQTFYPFIMLNLSRS